MHHFREKEEIYRERQEMTAVALEQAQVSSRQGPTERGRPASVHRHGFQQPALPLL